MTFLSKAIDLGLSNVFQALVKFISFGLEAFSIRASVLQFLPEPLRLGLAALKGFPELVDLLLFTVDLPPEPADSLLLPVYFPRVFVSLSGSRRRSLQA